MAFNEGTKYPTALDDNESLTPQVNNLVGIISVTYVGGATNIVLNDASQFPAEGAIIYVGSATAGNFERGTYASRVGNTLQTVNFINNTHNAGETVELRYDASNINNENAAIIALQNKVGVDNSSVSTSHERRIIVLEAAGSGISAVVDDTSPQLGGDLDVNGQTIVSVSNGNIPITPNGTGRVILDGLSYPDADGTSNQVMMTDGSGNLSFTTISSGITSIVQDTTPQLGGDLDVNSRSIVSTSNANINITPNGSGAVVLDGISHPTSDGANGQVLATNGSGQLSFQTPPAAGIANVVDDTSPQLGGQLDANGQNISMGNQQIIAPQLRDISYTVNALGNITGTSTFDMSVANTLTATVTGNVTVTFTNPPASGQEGYIEVQLTNGGGFTITWPASVVWDGGTAPTLQTTGVDILIFNTTNGGTTWRGVRGWKQA